MSRVFLEMYLRKNLGDDLFLQIIASRYPQIIFDVATKNDNISGLNLPNVHGLGVTGRVLNRFKNKIYKTKLDANKKHLAKIILGGSMFIEQRKTKKRLVDELNTRYLKKGIPLFVLGANFGPYRNQFYFDEYKKVFSRAKDVCFREKYSGKLFEDLKNVRVAPDIVFGLNTEKYEKIPRERKVVISVINLETRNGLKEKLVEYENAILNIADHYEEKGYEIVLMSFCKGEGDEVAIERILEKTKGKKIRPYYYRGNIDEALTEIASSEIIVGTRFHSVILGLVFNKKILPIIYSNKTNNMLDDLGFNGKVLEIKNIEKLSKIEDYVSEDINIDKQRKQSEEHFRELDKFIQEKMG